jgi:acetyl-CoA C-acetyltransferase
MQADDMRAVLVGGGQAVQRDVELATSLGPVELMAKTARDAAEDAGVGARVFPLLDAVAVVDVPAWRPRNAPRLLAEALGARPSLELVTALGGESPLLLVNHLAGEIAAGRVRAALLAGSNNIRGFQRARRAGQRVQWPSGGEGEPTKLGIDKTGSSEREQRYGLTTPPMIYPLFENALRAHRGLDLETHRARMGALMHRFTAVAASNPYAWFPVERSAEALTTPGPDNRMVAFPYPKYLNAVLETDQSAAVLLLSASVARQLGIPDSRFVHWWGGSSAIEEAWFPTERPSFSASDALRSAAMRALAQAGTSLGELAAFDLYSCFPVAVEMACEMLGLDESDPRGFTVTGGLPYFGGPGNNYSLHAVVSMAERLRSAPGARGLVTGNGWYLTTHSACVLASVPRESGAAPSEAPAFPSAGKPIEAQEEANGRGRVETYTVVFARDGAPERGIVVGRLGSGARFLANTPADRASLEDLLTHEGVGRTGRVAFEDGRNVFRLG